MPAAALYDIHGNLPALEAVLDELRQAGVDRIVVGGDVVPGPMPRETLRRLLDLDVPLHFLHGNGELAILALLSAPNEDAVSYWGTTSSRPLPEQYRPAYRWTAAQLQAHDLAAIARWPKTLKLEIDGLGTVVFCHATPRSETEIVTRQTPAERLAPLFDGLGASVVVCGHTHMQFERQLDWTRLGRTGCSSDTTFSCGARPTIWRWRRSRSWPQAIRERRSSFRRCCIFRPSKTCSPCSPRGRYRQDDRTHGRKATTCGRRRCLSNV